MADIGHDSRGRTVPASDSAPLTADLQNQHSRGVRCRGMARPRPRHIFGISSRRRSTKTQWLRAATDTATVTHEISEITHNLGQASS